MPYLSSDYIAGGVLMGWVASIWPVTFIFSGKVVLTVSHCLSD